MLFRSNPLRILDSKDEGDRAVIAEAPIIDDSLNEASRDFFAAVEEGLAELGIACTRNHKLVRGLDYYTHTAFEFTSTELGAQSAVLAGGRYDGLSRAIGGPDMPGVGWAAGIERLAMLTADPPPLPRPVAVVPIGAAAESAARLLAHELRRAGHRVELAYKGKPGQRMKRADRQNARWAVLIGEDELSRGSLTLRDLDTGREQAVERIALSTRLADDAAQTE